MTSSRQHGDRVAPRTPLASFCVLRAPLFSLDTLERWTEGAAAIDACSEDDASLEDALASDRLLLRTRLAELLGDPHVSDGLELTSPELADGVARWLLDPDSKRGRSAERSLVRYVARVASRPDLYGLAGAYLIGRFGHGARLELGSRSELQVRARVDSGLLRELVRRAAGEAVGNAALMVRRNGGVYRAGGRLRVAARVPDSNRHRLVAMRATPAIELALDRSADGASVGSIVAALEADGMATADAFALVRRLIASDLLIPLPEVTVTGEEPTVQALAALESLPNGEIHARAVRRAIAAVSRSPRLGRETVDAVCRALEPTGIEVKRRRCLHVDVKRRGTVEVPTRALAEMRRCLELLARIVPPETSALQEFKQAFEQRFGTRRVPLLAALDPDFGVQLVSAPVAMAASTRDGRLAERRRVLLNLIERRRSAPGGSVELSNDDVAALSGERPVVLPGSVAMVMSLIARDTAALAQGEFRLVEPIVHGPSGARLLGRLCRGDEELEVHVREHLIRDAALDPDVIHAELSAAPETDVGLNISQRPVLREWEIEYGGRSGADPARRLDAADLTVSVVDDEVALHSVALGRRVIPSSTTAINPMWLSLPAARFLLSIASQGSTGNLFWSWQEFADAPELPRVTNGRTIFALRRWNVSASELATIRAGTDAAGFRRLHEWRLKRGLPRVVSFDHPKSRVAVDFANVLSVDAFLSATKGVEPVRFVEAPMDDPSPVRGPDGRYAHELIVPFTLEATGPRRVRRLCKQQPVSESRRRFQPGSEWLYTNLYGPGATADRVLLEHVAPLVRSLRRAGLVDRWFFIRYADPGRHLRVRFHGRPQQLLTEVLPALCKATVEPMAQGLLHRISIDTYEREIERYGGIEGTELMELVAEADSDAVIEILRHTLGEAGRRHVAVASVAALYADAGLALQTRHACCVSLRSTWGHGRGGARLAAAERAERQQLEETLATLERDDAAAPVAALRERSSALAPILARVRELDEQGVLEQPLDHVMCSLAHMAVNRLLRRGGNHDELRVHDALARIYEAQLARLRLEVA